MRQLVYVLILIVATIALQGCLDVASSGAQAIYNRHSLQNNLSDQYITMQAYQALNYRTGKFKDANVTLSTYHGEVLLAGQVPNAWQKYKAEQIVRKIPDVVQVYNLIQVESPSSTLTRVSDGWITTKVKSKLMASNDVDATQVKVVTENGMVYLMGVLKPDEADAAVDLASNTDGVQGVVKLFSYIHISRSA